jgi:sugar phosphate permease
MNESSTTSVDRPHDAPTDRPSWVRWQIVALLFAFSFLSHFNRTSMPVAANKSIMKEFDISPTVMGTIYSGFLLTYTLCMIPGGWFSDRKGAWAALAVMGCGSGLFCALTGLPGTAILSASLMIPSFLVIRSLMGLFSAPIYPACARVVSLWIPFPQRSWANGLVNGAAFLGIASTFVVFGGWIDRFGWPIAFVISGVCTALVALVWILYATDRPSQHRSVNAAELRWIHAAEPVPSGTALKPTQETSNPANHGWHALLRNRSLIFLTMSYASIGYFEYLFQYWMHYYFLNVLHMEETQSDYYASLPPLALIVTVPLGGWISDRLVRAYGYRWGRAIVPIAGMITGAALLYVGALATSEVWIVIWFSLALGAIGACEGPCWATAIELGGRQGATAGGIFNMGGNVGGLIAPIATPWIGQHFNWLTALGVGSVVCGYGAILWLWIDPSERVAE